LKGKPGTGQRQTEADLRRLQHELEVHQIELEMQNEELLAARVEIATALERYTDLFDFAPVGYFDLAHDQTIRLVNLTGAKLVGLGRGSLIGRRFELFIAKTDRPEFSSLFKRVFETGAKQACEIALVKEDRSELAVRLEATLSPDGKECRMVLMDITERKLLDEQLRQAQKMEAIGHLAGGVAHDFNNILAVIIMQTDLLGGVEQLPADVLNGLQRIRVSAERAANLTRQLLVFSRRQVIKSGVLDLNEVITQFAMMLQRIIGEDVRLILHLHSVPLMIRADAGMIDQVLMNLAVNARDAMPRGGQLLIATAEKIVDESTPRLNADAAPGHYVRLSVSDTGGGIAPEVLPRIFEPFFTTKAPGKGTGLGLATVFGIVKQHQGWIEVENRPGQGVTFQIFLPASTAANAPLTPAAGQSRAVGGAETLLLVEDEAVVRKLTRIVLEKAGYRVLEAADGAAAQEVWKQHQGSIDLLLTDMVMPGGISGRELAASLQAAAPKLRVIFTSGYSADIAGRELSLKEGKNFIQKPCPPQRLLEVVRECLDGG
jgi:PAS domain S-box-containing protein